MRTPTVVTVRTVHLYSKSLHLTRASSVLPMRGIIREAKHRCEGPILVIYNFLYPFILRWLPEPESSREVVGGFTKFDNQIVI